MNAVHDDDVDVDDQAGAGWSGVWRRVGASRRLTVSCLLRHASSTTSGFEVCKLCRLGHFRGGGCFEFLGKRTEFYITILWHKKIFYHFLCWCLMIVSRMSNHSRERQRRGGLCWPHSHCYIQLICVGRTSQWTFSECCFFKNETDTFGVFNGALRARLR